MRWRRMLAAPVAVCLTAVPVAVASAAATTVPATTAAPVSFTLITGDRVTVLAGGATVVQRAPGREGVRFVGRIAEGRRQVIPVDALPLLQAGRLDPRLFDLTTLQEFGYTGGATLPLLVAYSRKRPAATRSAIGARAVVTRDLPGVGALAARVAARDRADFWTSMITGTPTAPALRPGIERIHLDGKRRLDLDVSVPRIGAPAAWAQGLDGSGVTVAVLDSGIDETHPDVAGRITAAENFSAEPSIDDMVGHGTHVASIIAGSGARSGGRNRGVAPGANLAIGKVCGVETCLESAILAGMEWGARVAPVVNMSLSIRDSLGVDMLERAVEDLTAAHGTLFVVAAGNAGGAGTVSSPGSADAALTVGAVDDEDRLAYFSSRGPRLGDGAIKPDITAPGVGIVAAAAAHGRTGAPAGDGYVSSDGTSMATPHVAGVAAILTQQHPGWSPARKKAVLMGAAHPAPGLGPFEQGAGRVDAARAVRQAISADQGSVSFGRQAWPHDDDTPLTRTLTYRNDGAEPVTLALAVDSGDGTFTLGATRVTVPAGGTAATAVTADTRGDGQDGFRTARVVATADGVRVVTPVAVDREVESYDVTVRHVGRDGQPAGTVVTSFHRLDQSGALELRGSGAERTVRLPRGEYGVYSWVFGPADTAMLVQPSLVVDGPATVTVDARRAEPVSVSVPRRDARQFELAVQAEWQTGGDFPIAATATSARPGDTFTGLIGAGAAREGFAGTIRATFARWGGEQAGFRDSPYSYDLAYLRRDTFFTGFAKRVRDGELATVRARYGRDAEGAAAVKSQVPAFDAGAGLWATGVPVSLPSERTEHLTTEDGVTWFGGFEQLLPDGRSTMILGPDTRYAAGARYREDWNTAVLAPTVNSRLGAPFRDGDRIVAAVPLFSPGAGHWGRSATDTVRTALYAGGELIGEVPADYAEFEVPAATRDYRLEMSAARAAPFRLSTTVDARWTFSSAHGDTALPVSTVRLRPRLDPLNRAPAGAYRIPVTVERAPGSTTTGNRTLTAEISVDDGRTWWPVTVTGTGDGRTLRVTNPAGGFVSLRVRAVDAAGNAAEVTVLRAYEVLP